MASSEATENESVVKSAAIGYTAEEFLTKFQGMVLQGFRLVHIPLSFPMGVFEVEMAMNRNPRRKDASSAPSKGPYTVDQMVKMGLRETRNRVKAEYGITARDLRSIIRKVINHQENINENAN